MREIEDLNETCMSFQIKENDVLDTYGERKLSERALKTLIEVLSEIYYRKTSTTQPYIVTCRECIHRHSTFVCPISYEDRKELNYCDLAVKKENKQMG